MSEKVLISKSIMTDIADAIRYKAGTLEAFKPAVMASTIMSLPGGAYNWMGANVELISTLYSSIIYLPASYSSWTASTTAKAFVGSKTLTTFSATNMSQYAYMLRWIVEASVSHISDATLKAFPTREISSSVVLFSSRLQSFPASGSFQMSQFFASGGQRVGVSASASLLPMNNIQD